MENKDYFIIGLGILGWIWGIIQFRLNRKYQKTDKAIEKRVEVYSNFMNQMDEMSTDSPTKYVYLFSEVEEAEKKVGGDWEEGRGALRTPPQRTRQLASLEPGRAPGHTTPAVRSSGRAGPCDLFDAARRPRTPRVGR